MQNIQEGMKAMKKKKHRYLRRGKGRAFLRFLVGEMVLLVVCVCVYLFVLQGTIELPGVEKMLKENVSLEKLNVNLPAFSTATPSPAPTATPVPEELYAQRLAVEELGDLSRADGGWLKCSLFRFSQVSSGGRHSLEIGGHAYLEGMDAQESSVYLLLQNTQTGLYEAAWQAQRYTDAADISFEQANGVHLEEAYYRACLDVTDCTGAPYRLLVCVKNGERIGLAPLYEEDVHFYYENGELITTFGDAG